MRVQFPSGVFFKQRKKTVVVSSKNHKREHKFLTFKAHRCEPKENNIHPPRCKTCGNLLPRKKKTWQKQQECVLDVNTEQGS